MVHPLRHAVLRTGRRWADGIYTADSDPLSAHFAALLKAPVEEVVLAVGSVLPEPADWGDQATNDNTLSWRVRGMAARADSRGSGLGTRILESLLAHVGSHGGGLVWCTARIPAIPLYERAGFEARGAPAVVPGLGAHQLMWTVVPATG